MTIKQTRYIKGLLEGKTKTQSALDAGYSRNTAITASQNIESPQLVSILEKKMDESGLDLEMLFSHLKNGLEAISPYKQYNFDDVPDHEIRLKYLLLAFKLRGIL